MSKGGTYTATILLTGAGGAAIPDLIRHLKGLGHRVLTADMDPHASGLYLGDGGFVVPPAVNMDYVLAMIDLCRQESVDVAIPLVDEELPAVRDFRGTGGLTIPFLAPSVDFVNLCLDKLTLGRSLWNHGWWYPNVILFDGQREPLMPTVIKPRRGRGSRGVRCFNHGGELLTALVNREIAYSSDLIAQDYIDGPEYTVSVVCDQHNTVHAVVPKEIICKRGATRLAVTRRNEKIYALCRQIASALNPCGPFNVQLRLKDGEPYVFEINPRFSGTVNLTIAAGCDEVGGLIELALGRSYTFGEWRENVVLVRQTHDAVMSEEEFKGRTPERWDI